MHLQLSVLFSVLPLAAAAVAQQPGVAPVVINEVFFDADGGDEGFVFVELFGSAGLDIGGWTIQGIEGTASGGGGCNPESFTFPAGYRIPLDGYVVVADADTTGGTQVANADFVVPDMDLENGPDAVQLLDAAGIYVDAVAYGVVLVSPTSSCNGQPWLEGNPARDVFAPLSIERCPAGRDTDDNDTDFTPNVPTPGTGEACCTAIEWVDQGFGSSLSTSNRESVGLDLWFGPCGANQNYVILAALTNPATSPPPPLFPVFDVFTLPLLEIAVLGGPFVAWFGPLDGNGRAVGQAALDFSQLSVMISSPFTLYIGGVALDPGFVPFASTNSVAIDLLQ